MKLKLRLGLFLAVAVTASVFVGMTIAPAASAAPTSSGLPITNVTCTSLTTGLPAPCTLALTGFTTQNGALAGVFTLTNTVTGETTTFTQALQANATCQILHLTLGPIDLNLLGLRVQTNQIVLDITAQQGPGNLLGNLLCSVANLLNQNQTNALATLLNRLLGGGLLTL